jgi:hypothetical protein
MKILPPTTTTSTLTCKVLWPWGEEPEDETEDPEPL